MEMLMHYLVYLISISGVSIIFSLFINVCIAGFCSLFFHTAFSLFFGGGV
jgi:hypothetical protein